MRKHIYTLDVLRFCAAFAVMVFHLCFYNWAGREASASVMFAGAARYEALAPFTWFGWVGVEVFFVISGFVIANSANGAAPFAFLKGRVLRLYPAVWVCALVSLAAWLLAAGQPASSLLSPFIRSVTLWISGPWIDGVYWSLAVEIVFYGLVFWALVARRIVSLTMLPWLLTVLTLALLLIRAAPATAEAIVPSSVLGWVQWRSDILLMRHGAFFAVGIWLWLLSEKAMTPARYAGLAIAIAAGMAEVGIRAEEMAGGEVDYQGALPMWVPIAVWLGGVAIVTAAARNPHWFAVGSPKAQAALKRIGLMTYPLFLVHSVAGAGLMRVLIGAGLNPWAAIVVSMSASLGIAYVVSASVEVAIRKRLRAVLDAIDAALRRHAPALGWLFVARKDPALP